MPPEKCNGALSRQSAAAATAVRVQDLKRVRLQLGPQVVDDAGSIESIDLFNRKGEFKVLLSADALDSQSGYRNAKATFEELLSRKAPPRNSLRRQHSFEEAPDRLPRALWGSRNALQPIFGSQNADLSNKLSSNTTSTF